LPFDPAQDAPRLGLGALWLAMGDGGWRAWGRAVGWGGRAFHDEVLSCYDTAPRG